MSYYPVSDKNKMTDARSAFICARLNLRGAKRLLQKGSFTPGISALYDAVLFGMHYYVTRHASCANVDLGDATGLFHLLTRVGVFDDQCAFNRLSLIVERALWQGSASFDANTLLVEVEQMLTKLGVVTLIEKSEYHNKMESR